MLTLNCNRVVAFVRALSMTVTANENKPPAVGVPLMTPLAASRVRPLGSPVADHV